MHGLNDKTIVLSGPFGLLLQNLLGRLTEYGANVALITDDLKAANRVCQNISDMREVSEKYGRAVALDATINNEKSAENIFSRSAEMLGGIDAYLDTHLCSLQIPFYKLEQKVKMDELFANAFEKMQFMTNTAASFLKSRTRGKILYMFHELDAHAAEVNESRVYQDFFAQVKHQGQTLAAQNTALNALGVGVSEEYLLSRFGKTKTIQQSQKEIQKYLPFARLVDYSEIANIAAFFISPLSTGVSGQIINIDHALTFT